LVRSTAYVLKFIKAVFTRIGHISIALQLTNSEPYKLISAAEITAAEHLLIKEHYRESELELKSLRLDRLNAHRTAEGLICCPNRLEHTNSPSLSAAPILLNAYRKAIRYTLLPLQQLQTLVTEIEAVLNARPLTSMRDTCTAPQILKPIDFISPEVELQIPPLDRNVIGCSNNRLAEWHKETLAVLDRFWDIWYADYLAALAERHQTRIRQGKSTPITPKISDIVVVAEKNVPRGKWPLGVIVKLAYDGSKIARSATVRMPNGKTLNRSLNQLYPLEITAEDSSTEPKMESKKARASAPPTRIQPPRAAKHVRSYSK
ncbi:hypothetical protein OESDEN_02845, partial [Oesophagostomum dentatum]